MTDEKPRLITKEKEMKLFLYIGQTCTKNTCKSCPIKEICDIITPTNE